MVLNNEDYLLLQFMGEILLHCLEWASNTSTVFRRSVKKINVKKIESWIKYLV